MSNGGAREEGRAEDEEEEDEAADDDEGETEEEDEDEDEDDADEDEDDADADDSGAGAPSNIDRASSSISLPALSFICFSTFSSFSSFPFSFFSSVFISPLPLCMTCVSMFCNACSRPPVLVSVLSEPGSRSGSSVVLLTCVVLVMPDVC